MSLLLENGKAFIAGKLVEADILIEGGKIKKIAKVGTEKHSAEQKVDCAGKVILPGLIDGHVHFRVPGGEYKEDWSTGSRAALAGGVTTVLDMPNTSPALTSAKLLEEKRKAVAGAALVNYGFHFGATTDNSDELRNAEGIASIKLFMGSSTGNLLVADDEKIKTVFGIAKQRNLPVTVHAEDEGIIAANAEAAKQKGRNSAEYHNKIRAPEAEISAVKRALMLQNLEGNRLHILHTSTGESAALIAEAKKQRPGITCEAAPHHLFLDEGATKQLGNFAKMNPPLRSADARKALWNALLSGTIDSIATDHAPHTKREKEVPYSDAPSGVPGIETMLPLLLDAVNAGKLGLSHAVELCCTAPARIFGMNSKGAIEHGADADLAIVDMGRTIEIKNDSLFTKCRWSPFAGMKLKGAVEKTIVNGNLAFDSGKFNEEFKGKEVGFG